MSEYILEMRRIAKVYSNGVVANSDVNFNLKPGEIHALVGENGAGKSTLMKMIFGMEQPSRGEIWLRGGKGNLLRVKGCHRKGNRHGAPAFHAGRIVHRRAEHRAGHGAEKPGACE